MGTFDKDISLIRKKPWLVALISAFFVAYPNNAWLMCDLDMFIKPDEQMAYFVFFFFRLAYFWVLIWLILKYDFKKIADIRFMRHAWINLLLTLIGFVVYEAIKFLTVDYDHFFSILFFQFIVVWLITAFISYINVLFDYQLKREKEIERLQIENLESRCNALTNQINPHFFFNSLNGISSLVRKKNDEDTLNYINELSDIFRYILQSGSRTLVTLDEELKFVDAFSHVMQVRYGAKLKIHVDVPDDKRDLQLPVLSLLPLLENATTHNMIDSEHLMNISISMSGEHELTVSNPVYPKLSPAATNGTGLKNLDARFQLMLDKHIEVKNDDATYVVKLPLGD
ncbi:MAG: histidine kinase [Bacteroidaceae bacterium]|nr:histidine kinase [Bacteroidaceae bacterium]